MHPAQPFHIPLADFRREDREQVHVAARGVEVAHYQRAVEGQADESVAQSVPDVLTQAAQQRTDPGVRQWQHGERVTEKGAALTLPTPPLGLSLMLWA
ncbi:hypothetical protein DAETH_20850 [Deinococcus aetherius]|uniref:Uncharacterized protein n=1 Tax=Deinococcus aetherius TaxID=200252 RepID=A0ABN6RK79_9DEIO|nr:hypothetical protein DAETH_20850 [Deinococcus aetherius]